METLSLISRESTAILRSESQPAEFSGSLTARQLDIIFKEKWFNMYIPPHYGGLGLTLPEAIRLIEELARVDGSVGWATTLGSGANLFIGYLDKHVVASFFSNAKVCLAGSGANTGTAKKVANGYIVNGKWKYATGALHATAFTANCIIVNEDNTATGDFGSFIFDSKEVIIERGWNSMGMKATGSHTFIVKDLFVPEERRFYIDATHAVLPDLIFRFPFLQFSEATLAANIFGMALHFTDECRRLFNDRIIHKTLPLEQSSEMLELLGRAIVRMEKSNDTFHYILTSVWNAGKEKWEPCLLKKLSVTCRRMVKDVLRIVEELYPYCGMEGADLGSVINRIWRDMHTASQHQLISFQQPVSES